MQTDNAATNIGNVAIGLAIMGHSTSAHGDADPSSSKMQIKDAVPNASTDTEEDWDSFQSELLSGEEIDAIAEHLKSTGQASA